MTDTQIQPFAQSRAYMDTIVSIQVPGGETSLVNEAVERAFGWFAETERRCSRFDPQSELRLLCAQPGVAVAVSPLLYRALEFAVAVAEATNGAFDPTVGRRMELRGFDRNFRTGETVSSADVGADASYGDIVLNKERSTVTLARPVALDLNAIAKGLAIDLAAAELKEIDSFLINAGGDIIVKGAGIDGVLWPIGIKEPFEPERLAAVIAVTDAAVCTSGTYERPAKDGTSHIISNDPAEARAAASVTVIAPSAMVADAFSTAAFALGAGAGLSWLETQGAAAMVVDETGRTRTTRAFARYI